MMVMIMVLMVMWRRNDYYNIWVRMGNGDGDSSHSHKMSKYYYYYYYYYYYIYAMMMRCWKWIRRWDEKEDGPKKMERSHEPTQQQTMRKNMKKYDQSTEKNWEKKKVCKLVKFSCFLSLPTEKLNFSKNNQFLPKELFLGKNNLSEHNYRVFPQNRGKSWESRPGSSSHWKKDRSTEVIFTWKGLGAWIL